VQVGVEAMKIPDSPPMMNIDTKESAWSIGTSKWMSAFHNVPSQLNVLIADGTAIAMVEIMNEVPSSGFIPLWNMWCPHTIQPRNPMLIIASTIE